MHHLRTIARSRTFLVLFVALSAAVPVVTLQRLPHLSPWPVALGVAPWLVGKYLLCPLRWRALTPPGRSRWWHVRAYAEGELLGLLTPGHVGADVWRVHRLTRTDLGRGDAILSVGSDRLVGALGLTAFVVFAGTALPLRLAVVAGGITALALAAALVVRRVRPDLLPRRPLPPPRQLVRRPSQSQRPPPRRHRNARHSSRIRRRRVAPGATPLLGRGRGRRPSPPPLGRAIPSCSLFKGWISMPAALGQKIEAVEGIVPVRHSLVGRCAATARVQRIGYSRARNPSL